MIQRSAKQRQVITLFKIESEVTSVHDTTNTTKYVETMNLSIEFEFSFGINTQNDDFYLICQNDVKEQKMPLSSYYSIICVHNK